MLTVTEIRAVKPQEKPRKLSDGGGLYLLINPNGRTRAHSAIGDTPFASAGPGLHDIYCHGPGGSQRTGRATDVAAASETGIKKNTKSRATRLKSSASAASPIRRTNALH
jgi:hypothetical protein